MPDSYKRAGQYLGWLVATLLVALTLSAAVLSGGEDALLRRSASIQQASSRPLVEPPRQAFAHP
jgi:hypothetical protein